MSDGIDFELAIAIAVAVDMYEKENQITNVEKTSSTNTKPGFFDKIKKGYNDARTMNKEATVFASKTGDFITKDLINGTMKNIKNRAEQTKTNLRNTVKRISDFASSPNPVENKAAEEEEEDDSFEKCKEENSSTIKPPPKKGNFLVNVTQKQVDDGKDNGLGISDLSVFAKDLPFNEYDVIDNIVESDKNISIEEARPDKLYKTFLKGKKKGRHIWFSKDGVQKVVDPFTVFTDNEFRKKAIEIGPFVPYVLRSQNLEDSLRKKIKKIEKRNKIKRKIIELLNEYGWSRQEISLFDVARNVLQTNHFNLDMEPVFTFNAPPKLFKDDTDTTFNP
jgi:hypothetical protein